MTPIAVSPRPGLSAAQSRPLRVGVDRPWGRRNVMAAAWNILVSIRLKVAVVVDKTTRLAN